MDRFCSTEMITALQIKINNNSIERRSVFRARLRDFEKT